MKLTLNKVEVARSQLRQSIYMLFSHADPVVVHTLAAAANQILYDLVKTNGHNGIARNPPIVRPDKLEEWNKYLKVPQNFFKHADRDPTETLEFDPEITEIFILDAVVFLQCLELPLKPAERFFAHWFALKHPDLLNEGVYKDLMLGYAKKIDVKDYDTILDAIKVMEEIGPTSGFSGCANRFDGEK
ncbi:MAG: hypothetical protein GC154_18245 [bacterium]|nr:hypothetical protein [bacterium]